MKTVFVDTRFWVARINPRDVLYKKAKAVAATLGDTALVTTQMVLTEVLNEFASASPYHRKAVSAYVRDVLATTTVIEQNSEQFHEALSFYESRLDKSWSLTDCASFLVMRARDIVDAATYDHHFEQAGFRALLR